MVKLVALEAFLSKVYSNEYAKSNWVENPYPAQRGLSRKDPIMAADVAMKGCFLIFTVRSFALSLKCNDLLEIVKGILWLTREICRQGWTLRESRKGQIL